MNSQFPLSGNAAVGHNGPSQDSKTREKSEREVAYIAGNADVGSAATVSLSQTSEAPTQARSSDRMARIAELTTLVQQGKYMVPSADVAKSMVRKVLLDAASASPYVT